MNAPRLMASCCSADQVDSALMEPCRDCPARARPHTRNGGAQVDTRSNRSDMPIVDLGEELFHADCWMGICARALILVIGAIAAAAATYVWLLPAVTRWWAAS